MIICIFILVSVCVSCLASVLIIPGQLHMADCLIVICLFYSSAIKMVMCHCSVLLDLVCSMINVHVS